MEIEVLYFAAVRELAGRARERIVLPEGVDRVSSFVAHVERLHPRLAGRLAHVRVAIDEELAIGDAALHDGAVVALIPPVAGGSGGEPSANGQRILLTREPLSIDAACAAVRHPAAGALAVFVGVVRDHHEGEAVASLEYSAYESMALRELARLVAELEAEVPGTRLAVHHRLGPLVVGDDAVICVASAPHREEAFRAGRLLIDRVKERVPIWKHEHGPGGARWVNWT